MLYILFNIGEMKCLAFSIKNRDKHAAHVATVFPSYGELTEMMHCGNWKAS